MTTRPRSPTTRQRRWRWSGALAGLSLRIETGQVRVGRAWSLRVQARGRGWFVALFVLCAASTADVALRGLIDLAHCVGARDWYTVALIGATAACTSALAIAAYCGAAQRVTEPGRERGGEDGSARDHEDRT